MSSVCSCSRQFVETQCQSRSATMDGSRLDDCVPGSQRRPPGPAASRVHGHYTGQPLDDRIFASRHDGPTIITHTHEWRPAPGTSHDDRVSYHAATTADTVDADTVRLWTSVSTVRPSAARDDQMSRHD